MTTATRQIGPADIGASLTLSAEAFGDLPAGFTPPSPETWPLPGRHSWGTFDGDRLVARVMGREYHSWWHGRQVPTNGIAGVAVAAEHRGSGLLDDLMATVLDEGLRERGEVLSTLYPTAPGIYRRYGYEVVTGLLEVELATARLARVSPDPAVRLRRATAADAHDVHRLYARWAAAHNGPLTRTGPSFATDAEMLSSFTAVTLAVATGAVDGFAAGEVVGFAAWHRGTGYDDSSTITVDDLVSLHAGATRSLWAMLGSHASVTGRVRLSTSGEDPVRLALPFAEWTVTKQVPYMLRVHDVAGALTGLDLGPLDARVTFGVEGDLLGTSNGRWMLTTADGVSTCVPAGSAGSDGTAGSAGPDGPDCPVLAPRGLALLVSGAQPCAGIRGAGLMHGDDASDAVLDTLFGRRRVHVRDYF